MVNRKIASCVVEELVRDSNLNPLEVSTFIIAAGYVHLEINYSLFLIFQVVEKNQWFQINDEAILEESVKLAMEFNPELVNDYRRAKEKYKAQYMQKILNEVLQNTDDRANLMLAKKILQKALDSLK